MHILHSRILIEHKGVGVLEIDGVILLAVVIEVAFLIHLEQPPHVLKALLPVAGHIRIEEIGQGFLTVFPRVRGGCGEVQIEPGIPVLPQLGGYDACIG